MEDDKLEGSKPEDGKLLQRFPSPDGKRWVELWQRADGRFYFQEYYERRDDVPDYGTDTYISPGWQSGLYERREDAGSDLRKMTPWLSSHST
jgi:hypothetical protein